MLNVFFAKTAPNPHPFSPSKHSQNGYLPPGLYSLPVSGCDVPMFAEKESLSRFLK